MSVDLPEPFWPTSAWTSPGRMSSDASMSARVPAKVLERCVTRRASRTAMGVAVDIVRLSPPAVRWRRSRLQAAMADVSPLTELMSIQFCRIPSSDRLPARRPRRESVSGRPLNDEPPGRKPGGSLQARAMRRRGDVVRALQDLHPHALDLRELLDRRAAERLAVAGELEAAVGHRRVDHLVRVDPHRPGAQRAARAVGPREVAGPDAGGQAVVGVVGDARRPPPRRRTAGPTSPARRSPPGRCACRCARR